LALAGLFRFPAPCLRSGVLLWIVRFSRATPCLRTTCQRCPLSFVWVTRRKVVLLSWLPKHFEAPSLSRRVPSIILPSPVRFNPPDEAFAGDRTFSPYPFRVVLALLWEGSSLDTKRLPRRASPKTPYSYKPLRFRFFFAAGPSDGVSAATARMLSSHPCGSTTSSRLRDPL